VKTKYSEQKHDLDGKVQTTLTTANVNNIPQLCGYNDNRLCIARHPIKIKIDDIIVTIGWRVF